MSHPGAGQGTGLGGARGDFPSTCWSRILGFGGEGPGALEAAGQLARNYWKPVYVYIRTRWAKSNEDAKDLTQDFFVWILEEGFLGKADPARGRFRAFVKVALDRYLINEERRRQALKRGGGRQRIAIGSFDGEPPEAGQADPSGRTPEEQLDRAWKRELFERAVELLDDAFRAEGKEGYFAVFQDYCLDESGDKDYRQVAAKHGISEVDLANHLRYAKRRFRDLLAGLVAETVQDEGDLRAELRELFGEERE